MSHGIEVPIEFSAVALTGPLPEALPPYQQRKVGTLAFLLIENDNGELATFDSLKRNDVGGFEVRMLFPDFHLHMPFTQEYIDEVANSKFANIGRLIQLGETGYLGKKLSSSRQDKLYVPFVAKPNHKVNIVGKMDDARQMYRTPDKILERLAISEAENPFKGNQRRQITRAIIESYQASLA